MLLTTDRLMKNQTPISTKKFPFFHEAPTMYMDRCRYEQRANDVPARALSLELMWRSVRWFAAVSWLEKLSAT